jgi:hypothetical protein
VEVRLDAPLSRLCSFARWLPKHAALVNSITITSPSRPPNDVDGLRWNLHLDAAQQLLQQALQLSTALPAEAAAAAAAAVAAGLHSPAAPKHQQLQQQQQQQQHLRLPNVTMAGNAGMLAALPAVTA